MRVVCWLTNTLNSSGVDSNSSSVASSGRVPLVGTPEQPTAEPLGWIPFEPVGAEKGSRIVTDRALSRLRSVCRPANRAGPLSSRLALEALAAQGYRSGKLTHAEVQKILGLTSRWETDSFLKRAGAYLDYTEADLEHDLAVSRQLSGV